MLYKWKLILTNWINCYFNESSKKDLPITLESLLDIISHLRENLNLDESKSSVLDAHTVQDFLLEKYPKFKFENRTVEPSNEEDICIAASLLLFFVCVNSKNVDIKSAMCSKLSPGDQEIILKYSKTLMECSNITYTDVLAAINEACSQDLATAEPTSTHIIVAETPPALRSYHSEVRRLQAALDAERFDRTYLQDELARTNLKVEKLLKDKEQYKLEIVDLKAKISLCCGEEKEAQGDDVRASNTNKLMKQLEQMEQQLLATQEQLDDVHYEKENYKSKLNLLKTEHENLLALSQQEMARAGSLAEDLETERRHTQSLRELVAELRQHNHLNRMDSSLLECDDPDTTIHSPHHNSSVCSEVCANVIEVQLGEERARIVTLKQQLQLLQEQIGDVTRKAEAERHSLIEIISDKENTITDLKHRINEEIEEKNTLKMIFQDDVTKLTNELNELEQRLKGSQENSRQIIDKKMQEIQNLQEEKLSLLQSLSDETTKSETVIQDLRHEIDTEKQSKLKLREDYDCHIMKLNEKVMNRSNELVELQNKVLEKGEVIEHLQLELQKEKQKREEISEKLNNDIMQLNMIRERIEANLQRKSEESRELNLQLQHRGAVIDEMNKDVDHLKTFISQLQEESNSLQDTKQKLLVEIKNRDVQAEQIYKETENLKNLLSDEKQKLQYSLDETSATVNSLHVQLQNEIQHKMELHNELQNSKGVHSSLSQEINRLSSEVTKLITEKEENDIVIKKLNQQLLEERKSKEVLNNNLIETNKKLEQVTNMIIEKDTIIFDMNHQFEVLSNAEKEIKEKYESMIVLKEENEAFINKLSCEITKETKAREMIMKEVDLKNATLHELELKLQEACKKGEDTVDLLKKETEKNMNEKDELKAQLKKEKDALINQFGNELVEERDKRQKEINTMSEEMKKLRAKTNEELKKNEKLIVQLREERDSQINKLNNELFEEKDRRQKEVNTLKEEKKMMFAKTESILTEKEELLSQLRQEKDTLYIDLLEERKNCEMHMKDTQKKHAALSELKQKLEEVFKSLADTENLLSKEKETISTLIQEKDALSRFSNELIEKNQSKQKKIETLLEGMKIMENNLKEKHDRLVQLRQETDIIIEQLKTQLSEERKARDTVLKEIELKDHALLELRQKLEEVCKSGSDSVKFLIEEHEKKLKEKESLMDQIIQEKDTIITQINNTLIAEKDKNQMEIDALAGEMQKSMMDLKDKDELLSQLREEKDSFISKLNSDLAEERNSRELNLRDTELKDATLCDLRQQLEEACRSGAEVVAILQKQHEKDMEEKAASLIQLREETVQIIKTLNRELIEERENRHKEVKILSEELKMSQKELKEKDKILAQVMHEKDIIIGQLSEDLIKEKKDLELNMKQLEIKDVTLYEVKQKLEEENKSGTEVAELLKNENEKNLKEKEDFIARLRLEKDTIISQMKNALVEEKQKGQVEIDLLLREVAKYKSDVKEKDELLDKLKQEKDKVIGELSVNLSEERKSRDVILKEMELKDATLLELKQKLEEVCRNKSDSVKLLMGQHKKNLEEKDALISQLSCDLIYERQERQKHMDTFSEEVKKSVAKFEHDLKEKNECMSLLRQKDELIDKLNKEFIEVKTTTQEETEKLSVEVKKSMNDLKEKEKLLVQLRDDKDKLIGKLSNELNAERKAREMNVNDLEKEIELKDAALCELRQKLEEAFRSGKENVEVFKTENEKILKEQEELMAKLRYDKDSMICELTRELTKEKEQRLKALHSVSEEVQKSIVAQEDLKRKDELIAQLTKENDSFSNKLTNELIEEREKRQNELAILSEAVEKSRKDLNEKDELLVQLRKEKDALISNLSEELTKEREQRQKDMLMVSDDVKKSLAESQKNLKDRDEALAQLRQEKDALISTLSNELIEEKKKRHKEIETLTAQLAKSQKDLNEKDELLAQLGQEKDELISKLREELTEEREQRQNEIHIVTDDVKKILAKTQEELREKDVLIAQLKQEKDALISKLSKELIEEREAREMYKKEAESQSAALFEVREKLDEVCRSETDSVKLLRKENEILRKTLAMKDTFAVASQEKSSTKSATQGVDFHDVRHQVDNTPTDNTHSSLESYKTISDLEKIIQDRNRTITCLQSDITYLKSLMAESENKLLDVSKDLEVSKENCQQLSNQLKKVVHQKNEEIADLKKQVSKMSVTENRASQIIKVSAKYQAIILKRIAEIKSNTVLKELTNFGNSANCDNDLRRSLNAGTITMEDLENFLDTTDRHLRRCSEKQLALQKERDRLTEVNRINESEIINMRKFLTELSVSIKTFNSVKELYTHKMSRVVSLQRTVRREILSLDGQITDATMCKLERGYAAVMQDLSECAMNLERWVERCIGRAISAEKIKQAFTTSEDRPSLASTTFQNTSLEIQLEELEISFCKLLEEVARAQKGEGAKDAQAVTVMEVRAEYEDKLNRMKAKMKQLYQEQISIFKEKQKEEMMSLEEEVRRARDKLEESSREYEKHIRLLTTELWNVGERFLMKQDEAEWLRRSQKSGSLMSLQHVHSSGLMPTQEETSRPSDTHSLRSLPVVNNTSKKAEGRGLHMSDEEGEVFDNRWLRELARTPRAAAGGQRLSELQRRNSLCPPHLRSCYPAETQFVPALQEEDIKCPGGPSMSLGGRQQRKEVGITAYKKPGPPTPSKQAGRLSATDSELRESLRVEAEPAASRKGTPSRIRALFRSNKTDTEGTPRSRRLSNIFRKK